MKKSVNLYVLAASVATAAAVHGFEATRAGMEDADLLAMLRRRDRAAADVLVRRIARSYGDYTPSCRLYREVRRDLLRSLAK